MTKLLACVDGSAYADSVCSYAVFLAQSLNAKVDLLHVLRRHSDYQASADLSGSIGLGARSALLEELSQIDESRGKLDQKKGKLILEHARGVLVKAGISEVELFHRRGALVETLQELEDSYEILLIGKRGEHAASNSQHLGSNLERVARGIHQPLFVCAAAPREIRRFAIAFDGKESTRKAVNFFVKHAGLNHLECHLVSVSKSGEQVPIEDATTLLERAGYQVVSSIVESRSVSDAVTQYVSDREIDWVAIGAYSHSPLHNKLLGSTTASLILRCKIPLLLFR